MSEPLYRLTVSEARELLAEGEITSVELTQAVLDRISAVEEDVKAYLLVAPEEALDQARAADQRLVEARKRRDPIPALLGVPGAIKDAICTKGMETTCGSRILQGYVPPYDATAVARLREAGAVVLGKANTDEFAMGSSTEHSGFHPTRNPWDLSRVPGGSSGGPAAAVAAGEALFALGTDTGGSVRQPAALCGVVGLRPTYGRVSRYGLVAFASSLDQIGPLARSVADCALVLGTVAGHDTEDATSLDLEVPQYASSLDRSLKGVRLGVSEEYFQEGIEPGVEEAVRAAIGVLEELGAELVDVSLPHTKHALPCYYLIAPAEASANLARYDGVRYGLSTEDAEDAWELFRQTRGGGFGAEVKRRIMLGTYALSAGYYDAFYLKAQKVRTLIQKEIEQAFERCDVILGPTSPTVAFPQGERTEDPLQMYLADLYTLSQALAGIPSISVPCGFSEGLPVGLQIMGPALAEDTVLRVAFAYEQATPWHAKVPPL
ncbi:MAG: Asp-tRNA(Asn)/Glu-tRNA(Gln) amidotransferase subunit GatA [Anaerolineae bacterium]